jgi:hypothetical protein
MLLSRPSQLGLALLGFISPLSVVSAVNISDPASLVNLFIGSINGGHTFPGLNAQANTSELQV